MTPAGAVPVAAQVSVTVPVKLPLGVMTRATLPEVPAVRLMLVEVLPVESATAKSGAGAPVPARLEVSCVGGDAGDDMELSGGRADCGGAEDDVDGTGSPDSERWSAVAGGSEGSGGGDAGDGDGCLADVCEIEGLSAGLCADEGGGEGRRGGREDDAHWLAREW